MMALVSVIARREIMVRVRDRAFLAATAFLLVIVAAAVIVPLVIEGRGERSTVSVVTVGEAAAATARQAASIADAAYALDQTQQDDSVPLVDTGVPQTRLTISAAADQAAAEALIRAGTADVAMMSVRAASASEPAGAPAIELVADRSVPEDVGELVARAQTAQRITAAISGATPDQGSGDQAVVAQALTTPIPAQRLLDENADQQEYAVLLGLVFATLFFLTVFSFGMSIAQSVVEEKQSRIVELLVSAVPVRALLIGKVLGNAALALSQIVLLLAVGLAGASIAGQGEIVTLLLRTSGWFILFFVLSFVMLACLWAAAGALASRNEDLQSTTLPLQVLVMVPFFASVFVVDPGRWLTVLSYFPFTAPLVMPRRLAMGDAAGWQAAIAAVIVLLTAVAMVGIGSRFYTNSLLRTQRTTGWQEAWRRAQ